MRSHADVSLGETGLAGKFDAEVTGDHVARGKPAPDLFLAAGMRSIAVPNVLSRQLEFAVAPEVVLESLLDAIPWLKRNGVVARTS